MSDTKKPFHMQGSEEYSPPVGDATQAEQYIDIGSIQTDPKINYAEYIQTGKGLFSSARIDPDGRIIVSLDLKKKLPDLPPDYAPEVHEFGIDASKWMQYPLMSIVIMIVGSRGDVQPYVALGKRLLQDGHRIRIASHATFRSFVKDAGLEFFEIGGNPQELMSYMVKNPGLIPGFESLTNGDIGRKRKMLSTMMEGCWKACHSPDAETGRSFVADAIISNPPAFAHIHCAEAMGIPLLLSFTMPWSPTTAFPHPLVNIQSSNAKSGLTNYLSYALTDIITWQGIGDIVNKFRKRSLGLPALSLKSGAGVLDNVKVPWTYCMSSGVVPKPVDWKSHIDVVGFYFLDLATDYTPPEDLATFLTAGEPPVYIGFGSVVVDDPAAMTSMIFEATHQAGVRALVSAGWGGLGGVSIPSHVFILGNIPHDWLFANGRVSAVVHHGGAGTTAIGLSKGLPTVVVPFFGDQGFWGSMIHKAGAGPEPIPHKTLEIDNLRDAIRFAISAGAKTAARALAEKIQKEDGVNGGVESFYRHLPLKNMRCDLDPSRVAVWWSTEHCLKFSAFAAQTLINAKLLELQSLNLHRPKEYETYRPPPDPVTGGASAIFWTVTHYYSGIAEIFYSPVKGIIHTTTAIPEGVMKIVSSVHEGFHNMPKLYGSDVRQPGKVTDFSTGVKEAGKGLFYGYYDGITGLVREPWQGAQKGGFMGAVKGAGRSFINATMRPAAGIVGVVANPIQGAWKSAQNALVKEQDQPHYHTRVEEGPQAAEFSTDNEKAEVVKKFRNLMRKENVVERKKEIAKRAEEVMYGSGMDEKKKMGKDVPVATSSTSPSAGSPNSQESKDGTNENTQKNLQDEAMFEREVELAKRLSLYEQ
ncbi:glycosyltransferase family 1 protein [Lentinula aciculospora]|uniref:Glycosyltransferase family 1 protein n=1 Tax=Lentinula aciculospora TaxID=153920 RepID=A0A9W9DPM3_9AGAR|nr:glycosyltransferase family 1 protein [Lentinula aciculospora]